MTESKFHDGVVVTGAAGFLGSHLVDRLLADGKDVLGLDNLSSGRLVNLAAARRSVHFRFRRVDLRRPATPPRARMYFHFASPASPPGYQRDPIGTLAVNSIGARSVLEAARRFDAPALLASTSEVYGSPAVHPQPESYWGYVNPIGPRSCYDEGKRFAEALGMAYRRAHGLDVRFVRIFNTYGPRMDPEDGRVVSNFVVQALRGQELTVYGSGRQTRSFCYVDDLIEGIVRLSRLEPCPETPVNIGNPDERTVAELARLVARMTGTRLRIRRSAVPTDDPQRRCPDISLARRLLGWSPRVSLEDGLVPTIDYFRAAVKVGRIP
jgi:nucleoside-diphosphate-sugar epimerase